MPLPLRYSARNLWRRRHTTLATSAGVALVVFVLASSLMLVNGVRATLLRSGQLEQDGYRPFYIALTAIAKRYLERRLGAPVLEMTSAEMTGFLREHAHGQGFATPMRELAAAADQIKFAKGTGQHEEAQRHVQNVRELLHGLEARLRPQAQARGEGSAA